MKLSKYLRSNYLIIIIFILILAIINLMLVSFKANSQAILGINLSVIIGFAISVIYDFKGEKSFMINF